jgi:hypothetical protein
MKFKIIFQFQLKSMVITARDRAVSRKLRALLFCYENQNAIPKCAIFINGNWIWFTDDCNDAFNIKIPNW